MDELAEVERQFAEDVGWATADPLHCVVLSMGECDIQADTRQVDDAEPSVEPMAPTAGLHKARWTLTWRTVQRSRTTSRRTTPRVSASRLGSTAPCRHVIPEVMGGHRSL